MMKDLTERKLVYLDDAIEAIVGCTNCGTEDELRAYVTRHSLEDVWSGGIVDALDAIEQVPSAQPDVHDTNVGDTIYGQAAIDVMCGACSDWCDEGVCKKVSAIQNLPPAQRWIPIKWHDCTDEDREKYGFSNDIVAVFDCDMPSDGQEILVTTTHGYVEKDVCYIDEGFSLDSGYDWIEDIIAWMPLPEPFKAERREE